MADDFTASELPATARVRGAQVRLDNPRDGAPGVTLVYERLITLQPEGQEEPEVIAQGIPALGMPFDPSRLLYLVDPTTDEFVDAPPVPWAQVYVMMHSLMLNEWWRSIGDERMADRPASLALPDGLPTPPVETPAEPMAPSDTPAEPPAEEAG